MTENEQERIAQLEATVDGLVAAIDHLSQTKIVYRGMRQMNREVDVSKIGLDGPAAARDILRDRGLVTDQ